MATIPSTSPYTINSADSSRHSAGVSGASDAAETSPGVPTLQEAEASRNNLEVDVDEQLLSKLPGGDSLTDVPLPNVPLTEAHPGSSERKQWTIARVREEAMVVAIGLGLGSCLFCFLYSNLSICGIDNYTHHKVFGSLRAYFIYGFCIGFILFIVLWDIVHAVFLPILACHKPPCDGVGTQ